MKFLYTLARRFRRSKGGATAVEYGLITAGISITLIVTLTTLGSELNETFSSVGNNLETAQTN